MPIPETGIPNWDRTRLAEGLRVCDSRAIIAFYSHFRPIFTERAELCGLPPQDCADAVENFLGDILLRLCSGAELPKALYRYLFVSFGRYASRIGIAKVAERRAMGEFGAGAIREARAVAEAAFPYRGGSGAGGASEDHDEGAGAQFENAALDRFAASLLAGLSSEERLILGARAEEMPIREIAALLGVNYNAANTRLCRLRSRLKDSASQVVSRMGAEDRRTVERFLRRARVNRSPELPARASGAG